ncbi:MAG: putative DNA binding domain-containing protein [Deltaproteobacteria bacterium]|nr:putative DNA binding domain-containing protein [Deltaproteobacteria bacterium]
MLNDDDILVLFRDLESDRVERKASSADMKKIRRAVCAFANDLPGHGLPGVVFVGVNDDGTCAGLDITDDLLKKLVEVRSNGNILPIPSVQVDKRMLDGCEVAVIQVEPSSAPPTRFEGRSWVRVGPTTHQTSQEDERVLRERARAHDQAFDRRAAFGSILDHLDIDYFTREYLPMAVASDVLQRNKRDTEEQLASLRFLTGNTPTNGAIMIFGREPRDFIPGSYVQFLRIDGQELGDPIKDNKELTGPLHRIVKHLDELLDLNISTALKFVDGSREHATPDYPVAALLQLIRNALIHRNYETSNAPVRLYWFNNRIEIHSPGGLYGQVTKDNFGKGATDYRNPLIAEAMANLGYVQRFGYGIPTAKRLLRENGNPPPEFEFQQTAMLATVRPRP